MPSSVNFVSIEGQRAKQLTISATAAVSVPSVKGQHDCWCDVDCWVRVAKINEATVGERAQDVTVANGYKIFAGNVITIDVDDGRQFGVIAAGAGTFNYHRVVN